MVAINYTSPARYGAGLVIGGLELSCKPDQVRTIEIRSGVQRALPSLFLEVFDSDADIAESLNGIPDGTIISVALTDGYKDGNVVEGEFITMGSANSRVVANGMIHEIHAVLNNLMWLRQVVDFHLPNAPASAMISQMAAMAGLKPEVDMTVDAMTWLPNRQPLAQYAEMVMKRAVGASGGAMVSAVTTDGRLRFKELATSALSASVSIGGMARTKNSFPYVTFDTISSAAAANGSAGYGMTTLGEKNTGEAFNLSKMDIKVPGGFGVGKAGISAVGEYGSRIAAMGVDGGNVHEKYYEALHAGLREKAAWNNDLSILLLHCTGLDVLDAASFQAHRPASMQLMKAYAGLYTVSNVVRGVKQGQFFEKTTITNAS
jgi:hypothetical protein